MLGGILQFRSVSATPTPSGLISTNSAQDALRSLSHLVCHNVPVLLSAPPSSGKTLLVNHAASILHPESENHVIRVHLADTSIDARSLFGSYASSPKNPGSFEWREGVIVRAMRKGRWLVLEDIDRASPEVLGMVWPLVDSLSVLHHIGEPAKLDVLNRGTVQAGEGFALFATRSVTPSLNGEWSPLTFLGAHKWSEVRLAQPTVQEFHTIVLNRLPALPRSAVPGIVDIWAHLAQIGAGSSVGRPIGPRELLKWCTRIQSLLPPSLSSQNMDIDEPRPLADIFVNPSLREEIFLEAKDVFLGGFPTSDAALSMKQTLVDILVAALNLNGERALWLLDGGNAELQVSKSSDGKISSVRLGRVSLPATRTKLAPATASRPFALHRPSLDLLSRLATCIHMNEPMLLSGETGTGKTTAITYLANLLNRPLLSLNLSQQTESSDLLGGFKPIDIRVPGGNIQRRFLELFAATFSREKNVAFEEAVRAKISEGSWKRVVALWKDASKRARDLIVKKYGNDAQYVPVILALPFGLHSAL